MFRTVSKGDSLSEFAAFALEAAVTKLSVFISTTKTNQDFLVDFSSVCFKPKTSPNSEKIEIKPSDLLRKPFHPKK